MLALPDEVRGVVELRVKVAPTLERLPHRGLWKLLCAAMKAACDAIHRDVTDSAFTQFVHCAQVGHVVFAQQLLVFEPRHSFCQPFQADFGLVGKLGAGRHISQDPVCEFETTVLCK